MYQERTYRKEVFNDLKTRQIILGESDLMIYYSGTLKGAESELRSIRRRIKNHIKREPHFIHALSPLSPLVEEDRVITHMKKASSALHVGPMASVAGAVSYYLGEALSPLNEDLIIENGGDLYVKSTTLRHIKIHSASKAFEGGVTIKVAPETTPLGICTSSGTLGHSLSFGRADAVVVVSEDPLLADAAATAIGNVVQTREDIPRAIAYARKIPGLLGILILADDRLGVWGDISLL
ncbi:MAG: hypothetical protein AVO33_09230 [delta proteobacterium ML8_F1]|nr:MAG: hypothetical protein AVO33_09230 [delta proteobacterium ML8_F1]